MKFIDDGPDEEIIHSLHGQDGTMSNGLNYFYYGGHDAHFRIDELEVRGSEVLFKDEEDIDRIFLVDNEYRTISTSTIMCALKDADSLNLKAFWISEMVDYLAGESNTVAIRENLNDIMMLGSNFPNPFSDQTSIHYSIKQPGKVRLDVYSASGKLIKTLVDKDLREGEYTCTWDGTDNTGRRLQSGLFIYKINLNGRTKSERMILLK